MSCTEPCTPHTTGRASLWCCACGMQSSLPVSLANSSGKVLSMNILCDPEGHISHFDGISCVRSDGKSVMQGKLCQATSKQQGQGQDSLIYIEQWVQMHHNFDATGPMQLAATITNKQQLDALTVHRKFSSRLSSAALQRIRYAKSTQTGSGKGPPQLYRDLRQYSSHRYRA